MNASETNAYIGLPWVDGARGPDAFDCWGLLRWVEDKHFGLVLPELPALPDETRNLYRAQIEMGAWTVIDRPVHGSGALLRGGDRPHVGVYLDIDGGGVLHAQERVGVVFTAKQQLRMVGYPRASWYSFSV
ncbi:NlpC/P60 family protein [Caballeronia sp. dw_19]|uniref:NlpC/P60 family protein n=1 Tax=Caballeronia sp. dw_19 TaxID=2719791 RepID=UPI001BD06D75|nr:NlpC/P60 family protein [Caballeronia sp. dw_19]